MMSNPFEPTRLVTTPRRVLRYVLVTVGVLILIPCGLGLLMLPMSRGTLGAARRMQCTNNLKQIGLGMLSYHDKYGCFPPAFTTDGSGNRLHSWRTLLLPFIEETKLYEQIDLDKPWNDPINLPLAQKMPACYHCPEFYQLDKTCYVVVTDEGGLFPYNESRRLSDITKKDHSCLMLYETTRDTAVNWMSPNDSDMAQFVSIQVDAALPHYGLMHIAHSNGSVEAIVLEDGQPDRRELVSLKSGHP